MELLKGFNLKIFIFFLIIFVLLSIFLLFIVMRNKKIIKNKNIKNYKEINQNNKLVLKLGKLFKILSLSIIIYFIILFILTVITFVLFPMAVGDGFSGLDTSGYELFFKYYGYYLNIVKYIWIFMVIDFLIYLVRTIICNYLNYKVLKSNEIYIEKIEKEKDDYGN